MNLSSRFLSLALAAVLLAAVTGCAKKPAATTPVPPAPAPTETTPTPTSTPTSEPAPAPSTPTVTARDLQVIYFGYDSFTLDDGARAALDSNAKMMRDNAALSVSAARFPAGSGG